jgi:ABC-type multidrug transport system ATPase subunit
MRTIATLRSPTPAHHAPSTAGTRGSDVLREKDRVRRTLGYLPQEFGVYPS